MAAFGREARRVVLGQFLPLATGSLLAPQLAVLASEAAAKSLPEGGQTEVGTNKALSANYFYKFDQSR